MRVLSSMAVAACLCSLSAQSAPLSRPDTTVMRFIDALSNKTTINTNKASADVVTISNTTRQVFSLHPNGVGQPFARVDYTKIKLPVIKGKERLIMSGWLGIREGFKPDAASLFDGVRFIVQVNNKSIYQYILAKQTWVPFSINLNAYAGKTVTVSMLTDPRSTSAYDWAIWGQPTLIIKGRPSPLEFLNIPQLQMSNLQKRAMPDRVGVTISDDGVSAIGRLDPSLDLVTLTSTVPMAKGQAPIMAAGEGAAPTSHTVVRVLNEFSLPTAQFMAYPVSVRGGVTVRRLRMSSGNTAILTAPASDNKVRALRIYTQDGLLIGEITPPAQINPPYAVVTGRFDANSQADQIAITSSKYDANAPVCIIDEAGKPVKSMVGVVPDAASTGDVWLSVYPSNEADRLLVQQAGGAEVHRVTPSTGAIERVAVPETLRMMKLNASAFGKDAYWASGNDPVQSIAYQFGAANGVTPLDLGRKENTFYIQWYWPFGNPLEDGKYIKFSTFRHLRTDGSQYGNLDKILKGDFSTLDNVPYEDVIKQYDSLPISQWEPCYTHRQSRHAGPKLMEAIDPQSKLPAYVMLTRTNKTGLYGEFDTVDFYSSTYATGSVILDSFYHRPHQAFLRALFTQWRSNPEHIAALEPNHEHEIAVEADGTFGDYNPLNLENFADYLRQTEGDSLASSVKQLGAPYTNLFDAPRQNDRGAWDTYEPSNPLFSSWVNFNRTVVNRFIAQTLASGLAAGFPPELLTTHQIPDTYAIGKLSAFSNVTSRVTPIDWAQNSGTAYGFTRYGVWYKMKNDALQDANRAGQNMISVGEYQALTGDAADAYNQLKYMWEHGVMSVHCMNWPEAFDKGFNKTMDEAIRRLMKECDQPRPGVTGGLGEIQGYYKDGKPVAVASIGQGDRTGLLKAVNADGDWTGDVYVTPFHSRILVSSLAVANNKIGPLPRMDSGMQVELTGTTSCHTDGKVTVMVLRNGVPLPGLKAELPVTSGKRPLRYTLRTQYPLSGLVVKIIPEQGVTLSDLTAMLSQEDTPRLPIGKLNGSAHQGGVNFAILE